MNVACVGRKETCVEEHQSVFATSALPVLIKFGELMILSFFSPVEVCDFVNQLILK